MKIFGIAEFVMKSRERRGQYWMVIMYFGVSDMVSEGVQGRDLVRMFKIA